MKRRLVSVAACLVCLFAFTVSASAAGFALYEYSARGNALGGAVIARADDPSTIAFNPAGLTQLEGTQVATGVSAILPNMDVKVNGDQVHGQNNVWLPPHLYMTHKYNDKWSFGVGMYTRFGLGTEYDADWAGKANVTHAVVQSYSINPNVAYQVNDNLSLAVGVEYIHVMMEIDKTVSVGGLGGVLSKTKAEGYGTALTLGMLYKFNDQWRLGVGYHSQAEVGASGDQRFHGVPAAVAANFPNNHVTGTVVLPDMINVGLVYYPWEDLSVEVGGVYTRWSTYNRLRFEFSKPVGGSYHSDTPKDWEDVWRYNVGVEYAATDWMKLRVGYTYDESPLNDSQLDYLIPGNDRQLYSVGVGFNYDAWTLDLSYTYLWMKGRDYANTRTVGSVKSNSHSMNARTDIYGVTVGYKF